MKDRTTILVTGAAGLFGANFSRHLLQSNYNVVGVDNLSGGCVDHLPEHKHFIFIQTSLLDESELVRIIKHNNVKFVYHFAAFAAAGFSPFVRKHNYLNNIMAPATLINACVTTNIKKIIFTSSMEIYGNLEPPFTEESSKAAVPETPYGIAKRAIELDLKSAKKFHGLDYSIIRPHNYHGIYQNIWDRYRNVIGIFIVKTLNDENLSIFGDGNQTRAFSDIKYCMDPLEKLLFQGSEETYNIGTDKPTKIIDLALLVQKIAREYEHNISIEHLEPRKEVKFAFCDHSKAKRELEFVDKTDLEELVRKMYSWAVLQPNRKIKNHDPEITNGLYSYWK